MKSRSAKEIGGVGNPINDLQGRADLADSVYGWHPNILGLCDGSGKLDVFDH